MTWNYAYSTPIWLSFFTVLRLIALSVYCWQNAPVSDRHIRCPLEPMLGRVTKQQKSIY